MGSIRREESVRIHRNYIRTAKVASLHYVTDSVKGIRRERKGKGFTFTLRWQKSFRRFDTSKNQKAGYSAGVD